MKVRPPRMSCTTCGIEKPIEQFPKRGRTCKACVAEYHLRWRTVPANGERMAAKNREYQAANPTRHVDAWRHRVYGLTRESFLGMCAAQGDLCAICAGPFDGTPQVDHDHATGEVRGILCGRCNRGIGYFGDTPDLLRTAADYIDSHNRKRLHSA